MKIHQTIGAISLGLLCMTTSTNTRAFDSGCGDWSIIYPVSFAHLVFWTPSEAITFEAFAIQSIFDGGPGHQFNLFWND